MCEQVRQLVDDSIRMRNDFPDLVGDHIESCQECSQYITLCSLLSIAGRPPVQMPPVALSSRIANSTFANPSVWSGLFQKPAVWAPALGVMAAAGWLLASPRDVTPSVNVARSIPTVKSGDIADGTASVTQNVPLTIPQNLRQAMAVKPVSNRTKSRVTPTNGRDDVKRAADAKNDDVTVAVDVPVAIPQNTRSFTSGVSGIDIAAANPVQARVPEISADVNHVVDVQVPKSTRSSTGRASVMLATVDEEAERDDLRASFQSQLNQQSESFRTANVNAPHHNGDSNRINVVNAPVVTGGK